MKLKLNHRIKQKLSKAASLMLITTMLAPNVCQLITYGADYLANQPRLVNFMRPDALTLADLELATTSDVLEVKKQVAGDNETAEDTTSTATTSNATLRQPEQFYDLEPDEPDGELVDFTDSYRTYQVGDGVYTTIFGGYSGYYQDTDGFVWEVNDTLCLDGKAATKTNDETDDDEDSVDMELINDLAGSRSWSAPLTRALMASASNATSEKRSVPAYENRSGAMKVSIPEQMTRSEGIQISTDRYQMEMIPAEGDFSGNAAVSGNAIRYTNVFDQIDYQYTVVGGGTVKEDIILMEPTDRNSFSTKLKLYGQKAVQKGNQIQIKDSESNEVLFILDAPYMMDADGERSLDLQLKLSGSNGSYTVTVTADQAWLSDQDRAYPVRIDPASAIPANEFLMVTVADGMPTQHFSWEQTPMVGYVDSQYGNCRVYLAFNEQSDEYMRDIVTSATQCLEATLTVNTMTSNSGGDTTIRLYAPIEAWNARTLNWNTVPQLSMLPDQIQTGLAPAQPGAISYDVKNVLNSWITGTQLQAGFVLRTDVEAEDGGEGVDYRRPAEALYNQNDSTLGPKIEVTWEGDLPGAAELSKLSVEDITIQIDPAMAATEIGGSTVSGVVTHGVAQAGASVFYTLMQEEQAYEENETTAEDSLLYLDFGKASLESKKKPVKKSNWQSIGYEQNEEEPLQLDTIYYYQAYAVGQPLDEEGEPDEDADPVTGTPKNSKDKFLLYQVQQHDLVKRIAKHYGVNPNQIARDNQVYDNQLTEAETILFIRNPKSDEPYTPAPMTLQDQKLLESLLYGLNLECMLNLEPINMSTGNFFMQQSDADLEELDGKFVIERSYNSRDDEYRSVFGMGWSSPLDSHLTVLKDGRILFKRGDGAGITFKKEGGIYQAPDGRDITLEALDSLDIIVDDSTDERPEEESEEESESGSAAGTVLEQSSYLSSRFTTLATEYEDEEAEREEDGENETTEEDEVTPLEYPAGWKMTDLDGTVRVFDALGFLQYIENRKGHRTTYVYSSDYELRRIETASGKIFDITMNEEYLITEISLPNGGTIAYGYDNDRNLTDVTDPEGGVRRYEYDDEHHMTAWYDENGSRIVSNEYDGQGRVISQEDALGSTGTLSYSDGLTILTDNNGNQIRYYQDDRMRNIKVVYDNGDTCTTTYGEDGHVASRTDELGMVTRYTYDERGNVLTERRSDGSRAVYTYNDQNLPLTATDYEGNTISFTYDEVGNLLSMTDGAGNTTRYSYDSQNRLERLTDANGGTSRFVYDGAVVTAYTDGEGNTWSFTYDEMNRMLSSTDPLGNEKSFAYNLREWNISETAEDGGTTAYEFDAAGCVLAITDANGVTTDFAYDRMYNILSGEDALGNTLTYTYDGNYNRISETDAKGNTASHTYDSRDRLVETTDALGNSVSYALDGKGNITSITDRRGSTITMDYDPILGLPIRVTDALGNTTKYYYNRNGQVTKTEYPDGTSTRYRYDGAGRVISTTAQNGLVTGITYDGTGNINRITDDDTRVYTFEYNHNNQLTKATDPLGGITSYTYDGAGHQTAITDARGNTTGYGYDAAGRLQEISDALDGTTSVVYDFVGNPLSATDANGHSTQFFYDVIGELLAQSDAAGNLTAMEYDALGNVTKVTDALRGETGYEVDALSRTVKQTDALGGVYEYLYDEEGNLLTITFPDGDTMQMVYDANHQITSLTDEAGVVTRYEYDSMGRLTKAYDNIGNTMSYEYDVCGSLVRQTDTIGRDAVYEYDRFNHLVGVTGTDLATTKYAYDPLDRLIKVTQADDTVTEYAYDAVGNLIRTTEPGEAVYTYAYDAINRLTDKVNPIGAATTFQYDAKGNLTESTDGEGNRTAYVYDVIDRLTTFTDGRGNNTVYEYDELSRLLAYTTPEGSKQEYRYDALSRMTKVKDPNNYITVYQYDVMGNLTRAVSPKGAKTDYTYDKHDEVTSITDPAGNVIRYNVDLNRQVTKMTQKNGGEYQYRYDQVHRLTGITTPLGYDRDFTYDVADNVIREKDNLDRSSTFEYDIMHRMTRAVDAKGGITTYGYDIRGNQNAATNALGYTWNYQYDLVDQLTASVDPEGKATRVAYNLVGQIESVTKPGERTTSITYDGNYNTTAITDPKGYVYEYTYDLDNRLIQTKDPLGQTEHITYDSGSRVTAVRDKMGLTEEYAYDPHGNVISVKATNGLITQFHYDILDNMIRVTMPSSLTATYRYDVMGNVTQATDTMKRTSKYAYDIEGNMTSLTDASGRTENMTYDIAGRLTSYTSNGGNKISYDYDKLNALIEKSYEDARDTEGKEGVIYAYDALGQRVSMMDRSGESKYEYDGLGRITKVTTGSGEITSYRYDGCDQLAGITYPDGKTVSYAYDKNDNLTKVTDRDGTVTTYEYDWVNRVTEIHRPNGVSTYNTYNARDQIVTLKNICDECEWVISQYDYTYDDRGFIIGEDVVESLYGYAWDDKHDGKHENWHDELYPHGNKHTGKHEKDGEPNYQIIGTKRTFEYDDDGKLLKATEEEDRQGTYVYTFRYDDMGNRLAYAKTRNGSVQESAEYTYNASNQMIHAKLYDGKKNTTMDYEYDADGNRISETGKVGTDKVELTYIYTVENRLKAIYDADELLVAMAYDGDGNRIFQLNYNLHTDDDWKGNSGNGNGNNKDNSGSGNSGNTSSETTSSETGTGSSNGNSSSNNGNGNSSNNGNSNSNSSSSANNNGNGTNNGNNGNHYGWANGNGNSSSGTTGTSGSDTTATTNTSTGTANDNNGTATGNTNNTGGSQNQSGILFPIESEVSELESELIGMIKTTGKEKNYELIEYVNDVNREYTEVLQELNINGIMDTSYTYGNERLTNERFTGEVAYYTYDPRGSVTGLTDNEGMLYQSYRYDPFGGIDFGKPQYNNVYAYNAESYNGNTEHQYLRARYYDTDTADFITEDSYLGKISDPLTLNRYNYVKSSPLNYIDPSGNWGVPTESTITKDDGIPIANDSNAHNSKYDYILESNNSLQWWKTEIQSNDISSFLMSDSDYADWVSKVQGATSKEGLVKIMYDKDALLNQFYGLSSLAHIATSIKDSLVGISDNVYGYVNAKVADAMKSIMSWAREACQSLECELATAAYDILLGVGFAFVDNVILQSAMFIRELSGGWDSYDSNKFRQEMEDWVIENGVTNTTYFYLGQIISDALQAYFAVKQIPKLVKKIGPMLTKLSSILAGAFGGGGGTQLAIAGVGEYAASIGITGTAIESLIGSIGVVGAGVAVVFADVTGIGHDAGKFIDSIQGASKGTSKLKAGDKTPKGYELTDHAANHANERGFSLEKIDNIIDSYSQKFYSYGEEIYCKKSGNYYDIVIKSRTDNKIVSVIGGNTHSLKTTSDIERFLRNSGRVITTVPLN